MTEDECNEMREIIKARKPGISWYASFKGPSPFILAEGPHPPALEAKVLGGEAVHVGFEPPSPLSYPEARGEYDDALLALERAKRRVERAERRVQAALDAAAAPLRKLLEARR